MGGGWGVKLLATSDRQTEARELKQRPRNPLYDFSILATLALIIFLIAILYSNLHHILDYLNVLKLFAVQEREDNVLNSRVSASVNVVFYAFTSLFGGLVLLVVFYHAKAELGLSKWFVISNMVEATLNWLVLSTLLFVSVVGKYVLLAIMTSLFGWREHLPAHYFNFVRLLFFAFMIAGACCLFFFVVNERSASAYASLSWIFVGALLIWCLLIALKLMARIAPRFFHLFSYLCAS